MDSAEIVSPHPYVSKVRHNVLKARRNIGILKAP